MELWSRALAVIVNTSSGHIHQQQWPSNIVCKVPQDTSRLHVLVHILQL